MENLIVYRLRLKLAKRGRLKFISHLETMHALARAARRANLPLAVTKGFSPHVKISWGPPLAVGLTSEAEYLDLFFRRFLSAKEVLKSLNRVLPKDLFLLEGKYVHPKSQSLGGIIDAAYYAAEVEVEPGLKTEEVTNLKKGFFARKILEVTRRDRKKVANLAKAIWSLEAIPNGQRVSLRILLSLKEEILKPEEIIKTLFLSASKPLHYEIKEIRRTALFAKKGDKLFDPITFAG